MTGAELRALMDRTWPLLRPYRDKPVAERLHMQAWGWSRTLDGYYDSTTRTYALVPTTAQEGIRGWAREVEAYVRQMESQPTTTSFAPAPKPESAGYMSTLVVGGLILGIGAFVLVRRSGALGEISKGRRHEFPVHYDIEEVFRRHTLSGKKACARALSEMLGAAHDIEPSRLDADMNTGNEIALDQFKHEFKKACL
jgi:hypothetical protein